MTPPENPRPAAKTDLVASFTILFSNTAAAPIAMDIPAQKTSAKARPVLSRLIVLSAICVESAEPVL